jgi:signal peptidase I
MDHEGPVSGGPAENPGAAAPGDPASAPGGGSDLRLERPGRKKPRKSGWQENIGLVLEVLVLVTFVNAFLLQAFAIPTASMEDGMLIGDMILADRVAFSRAHSTLDSFLLPQREIRRGMIVAFRSPPEIRSGNLGQLHYVKRVIGLPGDLLRVADNIVTIDGVPLDEPYKNLSALETVPDRFPPEPGEPWPDAFPEEYRGFVVETPEGPAYKVPAGHYFCMGDNRNVSADSRIWGPLPADCVVGKPWRCYWSMRRTTEEMLDPNILARAKNLIVGVVTRTRWNRILKKY